MAKVDIVTIGGANANSFEMVNCDATNTADIFVLCNDGGDGVVGAPKVSGISGSTVTMATRETEFPANSIILCIQKGT
jgi:hypothetical protein